MGTQGVRIDDAGYSSRQQSVQLFPRRIQCDENCERRASCICEIVPSLGRSPDEGVHVRLRHLQALWVVEPAAGCHGAPAWNIELLKMVWSVVINLLHV